MASLSDILSTLQNGVVAINNFGIQLKTTLNRISTRFGNYLPLSGGTLTGDLLITKANPNLQLNKTAVGQQNGVLGTLSGNGNRWFMSLGNPNAETGANAGSDFSIYRYTDAGAFIGEVFRILRADGQAAFFTSIVTIFYTGAGGANLLLAGDGGVTPNKYIRAQAGNLEFINSGYSAVIATLTDAGELSWTGSAWTAYTPTVTAFAGAFTTASASGRYKQHGKTVFFSVTISITAVGTGSYPSITLPVAAFDITSIVLSGTENGITFKSIQARFGGGSTLLTAFYDNTNPAVNGANILISGTYEAA